MIRRSAFKHSYRIAGSSWSMPSRRIRLIRGSLGLEPAEPFDGRDPAVLESIDSHDPGENRRILGNTDLAECATALNADYRFGVVDRLDDGVTRTLIAQSSQAANDDGADRDGLLVFLIFGNQRLDRFVFLRLVFVRAGRP